MKLDYSIPASSCSGRVCFTISGIPQRQSRCPQVWFQTCPHFHTGQCAHHAPSSSWKPTLATMRPCIWWLSSWSEWTLTLQEKKKTNFHLGQIPIQTHHPVKPELGLAQRRRWGGSHCHMWRARLSFWVPASLGSTQGNSETASRSSGREPSQKAKILRMLNMSF